MLCDTLRKLCTDFTLPNGRALRRKTFRPFEYGSPTTMHANLADPGCIAHCRYALLRSKLRASHFSEVFGDLMMAMIMAAITSMVWGFGLSSVCDAPLIPDQLKSSTHL